MLMKILSTGVLTKGATTVFEGITLGNLDQVDSHIVSVSAFDWTGGSPSAITLSLTDPVTLVTTPLVNPITLSSNSFQLVTTEDLVARGTSFYEIRITYGNDRSLMFNCYGLTAITTTTILPITIGRENIVLHTVFNGAEII